MEKLKLYPFSSGTYVVDKGTMNNKDWGTHYEHPIPMYAIEHSQGIVLFDTGNNHRGLSNKREWWGEIIDNMEFKVTQNDCMPWQLRQVGIDQADVKYVVISHLHVDHAGEIESFPNATFIVRESELRFAWWPSQNMKIVYNYNDLRNMRSFDFIELPDMIDFDVFGDGSLICVHTPGHTPGHQSLIVDIKEKKRKALLCSDACYLKENLNYHIYSANLIWNTDEWCKTISKLRHYLDVGYDLWFGHDMEDWLEHTSDQ